MDAIFSISAVASSLLKVRDSALNIIIINFKQGFT